MIRPTGTTGRWLRVVAVLAMSLSAVACSRGRGPVADVPVPREESWWLDLHRANLDRARQGSVDLLFLGDSITQGWRNPQSGRDNAVWKEYYASRNAANFGINGDATQHVLWRLRHGELDGIAPKVVVLLIGTNNLSYCTTDEVAGGVAAVVGEVRYRLPHARILLLGIFPRGERPGPVREKIAAVNARLARLDDGEHVRFLDIGRSFLGDDGTIAREVMPDSLHLTMGAYRIWARAMEPTLRSMLGEVTTRTGPTP